MQLAQLREPESHGPRADRRRYLDEENRVFILDLVRGLFGERIREYASGLRVFQNVLLRMAVKLDGPPRCV